MKKLSVYVHIPFCVSKCAYCDFLSFTGDAATIKAYTSALCAEIELKSADLKRYTAQTIYFGGGTPTSVPPAYIIDILSFLLEHINVAENAEISIETNPETVNIAYMKELRQAGFNRVSMGVQTFDDNLLARINRAHTSDTARDAYAICCEAGFENISIDLMFSIPGQDYQNFQNTLNTAVDLSPEHISCYGLTVEPSTLIGEEGYEPDEYTDRRMYEMAVETLTAAGYEHYEISNFALPGYRSRHNTAYWTGSDYKGFGLGAHSLINNTRFNNETDVEKYIKTKGLTHRRNIDVLKESDIVSEYIILGLRMLDGINCKDFSLKFDKNIYREYGEAIRELTDLGLLTAEGDVIKLTMRGIDLSNQVFSRFI